jgi:D-aminopeptidase
MNRARSRELGIITGTLPTGQWNAITDVAGVLVGYSTLNRDTPSIAHTGVTAIWPRSAIYRDSVFAGVHSFNGYGEMTGTLWIDEQGLVSAPICITNTYSVGTVRDAVCEHAITHSKSAERSLEQPLVVHLPVVAETWDGFISDIDSMPVTKAMAFEALSSAASGPIAEGNVGGGTGMVCHEFKGGTGTASRVTHRGYTVGALVQTNYGARELLCVGGVPVGRELGVDVVPSPERAAADSGSIIVVLATDAPLLPIQCQRLAKRATVGLAKAGGIGANSSGDIYLAFSTANHLTLDQPAWTVETLAPFCMSQLFRAAAEAVEEAILNSLFAAETMTGFQGRTAHAIPLDQMLSVMRKHRWTPSI